MCQRLRTWGFLLRCLPLLAAVGVLAAQPAAVEKLWGPQHVLAFAEADALTIPESRRKFCRYLSLHNYPAAERVQVTRIVGGFFLNSVSTERTIVTSQNLVVPGTDGTLLRFFTDDYEMFVAAFDSLAALGSGPDKARSPEGYFSTLVAVQTKDGIKLKASPKPETSRLRQLLHSEYPILRADWFLYYGSMAPAYYDLLGMGRESKDSDEKDFEKITLGDKAKAERARVQTKGVVVFSSVAQHNRTLTRIPTISGIFGGYYWTTHDTASAVNDRDYINVLLNESFDAQELIASLPNGLQAYFLTDGKAKRLDVADINVALDKESRYKDPQVWAMRNCVSCHTQGLRDINEEVRGLSRDKVFAQAVDPKQARRIADLYFAVGMQEVLTHDKAIYKSAIARATAWPGLPPLTPEATATTFERLTSDYYDKPVDLATAARELGYREDQARAVLENSRGIDHSLTSMLNGGKARRDQFEVSIGQLQRLMEAAKP